MLENCTDGRDFEGAEHDRGCNLAQIFLTNAEPARSCVLVGPDGHHGAMATRDDAQAILEQLAGPTARLRDDQWTAIEALVVHRRRALVVQRTGWGKSAVYFIAAKLLRGAGHGATVIVSPLLALMRNQVAAAERAGVHAATINSSNVA